MKHIKDAFEQAKEAYPEAWVEDEEVVPSLLIRENGMERHTWQLVDAIAASVIWERERDGMLVLQESKVGDNPVYYWQFMISKDEILKQKEQGLVGCSYQRTSSEN